MLILTAVAALGSLLGVLFLILKKPGQQALRVAYISIYVRNV